MKIAHAPYEHIPDIITKYSIKKQLDISLPRRQIKELSFPSNTTEELVQSHVNYLQKRNFDPKYLQIKYHIKSIGPASERAWSNRILIPYLFKERIVTFTARDSTEFEWRPRYKACLPEESEIPIDHILYNINSVKEIAVIVEGPTDVWRMGDGFVAMGGLQWNSQRIYLLKDCKQVFIWPDKEHAALLFWEKLAHSLSFIKDVRFVELSEGDPGSLDEDSARNFRREIFGRKYR
uniref:Putative DNA primase n=1 Tax=viral metagenome TaxID=1070528 RepID=A0A6M3L3K5_9ZZZZ